MSEITELEQQLRIANELRAQAVKALAPEHKGGEWEKYDAAQFEVLRRPTAEYGI